MKTTAQLKLSIDRFREGFWGRQPIDHPPLGVFPDRSLLPINYLKTSLEQKEVLPAEVTPELARTDFEDMSFARRVFTDDWMPFSAAWRAIPWLEAVCGCGVRVAEGSLSADHFVTDVHQLPELPFPGNTDWVECFREQTSYLVDTNPPDCWISQTIIRGLSDTLAGLRGLNGFFLDVYDEPDIVDAAASRIATVLLDLARIHRDAVAPNHDGYGHIFGYWAPKPTFVLQEDMMGLCAPEIYRDHFQPLNAQLVEALGACTLFHIHTTGYQHFRHVLDIPGLDGLQLTVEANGPSLRDLAPVFHEILEQTRLILFVDAQFDDLSGVLRSIRHEGLYVMISDRFIPDEEHYQAFLAENWGHSQRRVRSNSKGTVR